MFKNIYNPFSLISRKGKKYLARTIHFDSSFYGCHVYELVGTTRLFNVLLPDEDEKDSDIYDEIFVFVPLWVLFTGNRNIIKYIQKHIIHEL